MGKRMDYLTAARYDDKIDAMREAEIYDNRWLFVLRIWNIRQSIEDKRNSKRLEAYVMRRSMRVRNEMRDNWLLAK